MVEFYDVRSRTKVSVEPTQITKVTYESVTKSGKPQVRYALRAEYNGGKLTKFVSQSDWDALDVPRA